MVVGELLSYSYSASLVGVVMALVTISVRNSGAIPLLVQNANLIVERVA